MESDVEIEIELAGLVGLVGPVAASTRLAVLHEQLAVEPVLQLAVEHAAGFVVEPVMLVGFVVVATASVGDSVESVAVLLVHVVLAFPASADSVVPRVVAFAVESADFVDLEVVTRVEPAFVVLVEHVADPID